MKSGKKWFQKTIVLLLVTAFALAGQTDYPVVSAAVPEKAQAQPAEKEKPEKQIIGKTETATIYDLGGGKKKAEIYPHKIRYRDGDELVDYDTTLTKVTKKKTEAGTDLSRYAYGTSRGRTPVYMPETLTGETPVFTENGDYQVQLVPITPEKKKAEKPEKQTAADLDQQAAEKITSVKYEEPLPDADFQYEAQADGLKETILLHSADAQSTYRSPSTRPSRGTNARLPLTSAGHRRVQTTQTATQTSSAWESGMPLETSAAPTSSLTASTHC